MMSNERAIAVSSTRKHFLSRRSLFSSSTTHPLAPSVDATLHSTSTGTRRTAAEKFWDIPKLRQVLFQDEALSKMLVLLLVLEKKSTPEATKVLYRSVNRIDVRSHLESRGCSAVRADLYCSKIEQIKGSSVMRPGDRQIPLYSTSLFDTYPNLKKIEWQQYTRRCAENGRARWTGYYLISRTEGGELIRHVVTYYAPTGRVPGLKHPLPIPNSPLFAGVRQQPRILALDAIQSSWIASDWPNAPAERDTVEEILAVCSQKKRVWRKTVQADMPAYGRAFEQLEVQKMSSLRRCTFAMPCHLEDLRSLRWSQSLTTLIIGGEPLQNTPHPNIYMTALAHGSMPSLTSLTLPFYINDLHGGWEHPFESVYERTAVTDFGRRVIGAFPKLATITLRMPLDGKTLRPMHICDLFGVAMGIALNYSRLWDVVIESTTAEMHYDLAPRLFRMVDQTVRDQAVRDQTGEPIPDKIAPPPGWRRIISHSAMNAQKGGLGSYGVDEAERSSDLHDYLLWRNKKPRPSLWHTGFMDVAAKRRRVDRCNCI